MPHYVIASLSVAIFALTSGSARAECKPMTVKSDVETRHGVFADLDGSGSPSAGDKRMGERILTDADGQPVGTLYWINTVSEVGDDGKPTAFRVNAIYAFEDGTVFDDLVHNPVSDYADAGRMVLPLTTQKRIIGGTRAYAGAHGTTEQKIDPDTRETVFTLDISCE